MHWLDIEYQGEALRLAAGRALHWPREKLLMIADPHFGKDSVFRRQGVAVPQGDTAADLQRLEHLLTQSGATQLVVLGDFMHAPPAEGEVWAEQFSRWRARHDQLHICVTRGNHDRMAQVPAAWRLEWLSADLVRTPFIFRHEPAVAASAYVFCGHLHPVVRLQARGESLRTPVFWFGHDYCVLPAFGSFTGGAAIQPRQGERVFAVGPEVVELKLAAA